MQAKRIQVNESNDGAGAQTSVFLFAPTDPREEINFHNVWAGVTVEPQNADANCQGTWVLGVIKENSIVPSLIDVIINNETNNQIIVACGVFSASNEMPWTSPPIHPQTSRTLQAGDAFYLTSVITGITSGTASNRVMLCAHTTRK